MPYVNTLWIFVRKGSFSSALMAAIAYGHMELKPNVTFLRSMSDNIEQVESAAKELTASSTLFRDDVPLYIMTFGISPGIANILSDEFKLNDVPCVLFALEANTMPHHSLSPEQIKRLGDFYDIVGYEEFVFYVSRCIRNEGEDYDPCGDTNISNAMREE